MSALRTRITALVVVSAIGLTSCITDQPADHGAPAGPEERPTAPEITTEAAFEAHGSVEEAYVVGADPGQEVVLADAEGREVATGAADEAGSLVVRNLEPGDGYTFRAVEGEEVAGSPALRVLDISDTPEAEFYEDQELEAGLNYITMRDGVTLAATVRLPQGKTLEDGPFPTVIEYSGYAIAAPHDPLVALTNPEAAAEDPLVPSTSTAVGGIIAPLLGYATVSLQMRGSGCSGGAMGLFDLPTTADGYDAVEIVAAEPWVKGNKVGMVGISFSGISQLFVAGAQPPHLAAIAPLSVTDDLYSTGVPGAVRNDGFAASWLEERASDAEPAPDGGQPWARAMIEDGDEQCLENQDLRLQTQDADAILGERPDRAPELYDDRSPARWAEAIDVPVFMVGALQDEQTGGQWPALVPAMQDNPDVWVTMMNGTHVDSLGPATITRWVEFLDLFVADRVPVERPLVTDMSGMLYEAVAGAPAQGVPALRFTDSSDLEGARDSFREDPRVRVLMDNGGDPDAPGSLGPQWEVGFEEWPPPAAEATAFYLADDGALTAEEPEESSTVSFRPDPSARPRTSLSEGDPWAALPPYEWAPVTGESGLGFISDPLDDDLTVMGPASLDLWLESTAEDTDLQVTISEVRPDGQEMFVQSGLLRASSRALDTERSTELVPVPSYLAEDIAPLPADGPSEVRIPMFPIAYSFREGSQIRITITAPGGDRPAWTFDTPETGGEVTDTLSLGGATASRLVLPVLADVEPSDAQPACPSLRGQPCRRYEAAANGG